MWWSFNALLVRGGDIIFTHTHWLLHSHSKISLRRLHLLIRGTLLLLCCSWVFNWTHAKCFTTFLLRLSMSTVVLQRCFALHVLKLVFLLHTCLGWGCCCALTNVLFAILTLRMSTVPCLCQVLCYAHVELNILPRMCRHFLHRWARAKKLCYTHLCVGLVVLWHLWELAVPSLYPTVIHWFPPFSVACYLKLTPVVGGGCFSVK